MSIVRSTTAAARSFCPGAKGDAACILLLVVLTACLLLPHLSAVPMIPWDEGRNANNALEMMRGGGWLVTSFNGVPDHWNCKPPLLIWMIAALLKIGAPPLYALRLPSFVATLATVVTLYGFCRWILMDRLAGMLSALLLLSSSMFLGVHVALTGDYDALLSLFTTCTVLASWIYLDGGDASRSRWVYAIALALLLGILTKGIAALMVGPGILAYAISRGRLWSTLRDQRVWVAGGIVLSGCVLYYGGRAVMDPGYLQAVWYNDIGGRYATALDHHSAGAFYYVGVLTRGFQPGVLFLPLVALPLIRSTGRSHDAVLLSVLVSAVLLIVLSGAGTKAYWYAAPVIPLFSLAIGISLPHGIALVRRYRRTAWSPIHADVAVQGAVLVAVCAGLGAVLHENQFALVARAQDPGNSQLWYATMLDRNQPEARKIVIVDAGLPNNGGLTNYNPVAKFYRDYTRAARLVGPGSEIGPSAWVVTCDPEAKQWLASTHGFLAQSSNKWCALGRTAAADVNKPG